MSSFRPSEPPFRGNPSPQGIELRTEPGVYGYNLWKNISIGVWVGQATLPAVRGIGEIAERMRRFKDGRSSVVFVLAQLPAPTPEAQEEFARVYQREGLALTAVILEGDGFWASGIRGMTNNMHRVSASAMLQRVCTTIDEVVTWFPEEHLKRTGVQIDRNEFAQVLRNVRREAAARALGTPVVK